MGKNIKKSPILKDKGWKDVKDYLEAVIAGDDGTFI